MSSPTAPPLAEQAQAAQAGLALMVAAAMTKLWPSLDLLHLRSSLPAFKAAVAQEVQRHAQAAATLAARDYTAMRQAAGVAGRFTARVADPPSVEQIAQAVDWATQPLWDSSVPVATAVPDAPEETRKAASTAIAEAKARVAAAADQAVHATAQDTYVENVAHDRQAKGWYREPNPGACSFCAMLASRGPCYREDSFSASNKKFKGDARAKIHNNCHCRLLPYWNVYEPSAQVRAWRAKYKEVADEIGYPGAGVSAADMQVAFRQALEGRPIDLARARNMRADKAGKPRPSGSARSPKPKTRGESTPEEQAAMMRAERKALQDRLSTLNEQQRGWVENRITALDKLLGE